MSGRAAAGVVFALLVTLTVGCTVSSGAGSAPVTSGEAASQLAAHARALLGHDRRAFLAGVGTAQPAAALRTRQQAQFDNITDVPRRTYAYTVSHSSSDTDAQRAVRRHYGASAVVYVLILRVALREADRVAAPHDLWWTFARQGDRVVAVADDAQALVGGVSWREPWDFAPGTVVRALVGASPLTADQAGASGLRAVLHEALAAYVAQWRAHLRAELGR